MKDKKTHTEEAAQLRHQAEMIYRENAAPFPADAEVLGEFYEKCR